MTVKMLHFQSRDSLAAVQFVDAHVDTFSYITGATAIEKAFIAVGEVGEAGRINTLIISNHSPYYVFFMDGDLLVGAKQNRVLATSVLLAPKTETKIPVSCVERGRWRFTSPSFKAARHCAPSSLRARKAESVQLNLQQHAGFVADQSEVWGMVAEYEATLGVASPTSSLSDVYDQYGSKFANNVQNFKPHPEANGVAIFVGNRLLGLDSFNRRDIFGEYFPGLLRAAALEAFHLPRIREALSEAEARYAATEAVNWLESQDPVTFPGAGVGQEKRFEGYGRTAFELWFESHLIHRAVFNSCAVM